MATASEERVVLATRQRQRQGSNEELNIDTYYIDIEHIRTGSKMLMLIDLVTAEEAKEIFLDRRRHRRSIVSLSVSVSVG